jgi:hypothetical protein
MQNYRALATAAQHIHASEEVLLEFGSAGWIDVVRKNGLLFISGQDEYRARFILHLRQKLMLDNKQILIVLTYQEPPYSLDQVPDLLAQHSAELH